MRSEMRKAWDDAMRDTIDKQARLDAPNMQLPDIQKDIDKAMQQAGVPDFQAQPNRNSPQAADVSRFTRVRTTPEELIRYFQTNEVAATDWAKDKQIEITAKLSYVANNMFGGERVCVVFQTRLGSEFLPSTVQYWFDGKFRSRIGALREGQTVTCVGTFTELDFDGSVKLEGLEIR
jgi:hypothetical protein